MIGKTTGTLGRDRRVVWRRRWSALLEICREDVTVNGNMGSRASLVVYRYGRALFDAELCDGKPTAKVLQLIYRTMFWAVCVPQGCQLDPRATIGRRLQLPHGGNGIVLSPEVVIGDDVTIFHQVTLGTRDVAGSRPGSPMLGDGVIVYVGAKIIGPVTVGAHGQVGANAVVTRDVAPGVTVGGIPARPLTVGNDPGIRA